MMFGFRKPKMVTKIAENYIWINPDMREGVLSKLQKLCEEIDTEAIEVVSEHTPPYAYEKSHLTGLIGLGVVNLPIVSDKTLFSIPGLQYAIFPGRGLDPEDER